MSYPKVKLSNICVLHNGRAYNKDELLDEGKYPVLRVGNFFSNRGWYYSDLELADNYYCDYGDLLYAWSASFGPKIWDGSKAIYHYHIWKISLNENLVDKKYLLYALAQDVESIKREQGSGSTMIHVTKSAMEQRLIPLPPLAEQKRIAAILDKADAIRRKRQQAIQLADHFLRSVFLDMFGDPVTNPKGWEVKPLDSCLDFLTSGSRGWAQYYSDQGDKFIRIQNVGKNKLLLDDMTYVTAPNGAEAIRTKVRQGDVLLSITADLGRSSVVTKEIENGFINQHLAILRVNQDLLNPRYLAAFLSSEAGVKQFTSKNKSAVKAGLNFSDIRSVEVAFPPINLQRGYEAAYEKIVRFNKTNLENHTQTTMLFNSLSQKAFSGQL